MPSKAISLTWGDVDWERGQLSMPSPKTEQLGKPHRVHSLFSLISTAGYRKMRHKSRIVTRFREKLRIPVIVWTFVYGSVWESNPLRALFKPATGFEDQGPHQRCKHSQLILIDLS